MMTDTTWRGLASNERHRVASRNSPSKRAFDVAFLTGEAEHEGSVRNPCDDALVPSSCKVIKVGVGVSGGSESPPPPKREDPESYPAPTRNLESSRYSQDDSSTSAFKKVSRSSLSPNLDPSSYDAPSAKPRWTAASSHYGNMNSFLGGPKTLPTIIGRNSFLPHALVPLLSTSSASEAQHCLNNNLVEEYIKTQQQLLSSTVKTNRGDITPTEALSRLRSSIITAPEAFKLPFGGLPYNIGGSHSTDSSNKLSTSLLSQSPVSALVPSSYPPMSLQQHAQNMCAKCNISFRMTSDLVYHMRSQHKREPDPLKKRRNEKLKCPICCESFRERHHLTRHMTAHNDRAEEACK